MLSRTCIVQIQPRKPVLDNADYIIPTRHSELYCTDQACICPERSTTVDHQVAIDYLSEVLIFVTCNKPESYPAGFASTLRQQHLQNNAPNTDPANTTPLTQHRQRSTSNAGTKQRQTDTTLMALDAPRPRGTGYSVRLSFIHHNTEKQASLQVRKPGRSSHYTYCTNYPTLFHRKHGYN